MYTFKDTSSVLMSGIFSSIFTHFLMYVYHILSCNQLIFSHQVFLTATKKICQNKVPLIHQVIPIINIVSKALDEFIDDATLPSAICSAAVRGSLMLNKYYSKTDESVIFCVAMSVLSRMLRFAFISKKLSLDMIRWHVIVGQFT